VPCMASLCSKSGCKKASEESFSVDLDIVTVYHKIMN
jgi:hypothetical protein